MTLLSAAAVLALAAGLAGCAGSSGSPSAAGATPDATADASAAVDGGGSGTDTCSLVPTAELAAAIGADPGVGVAAEANGLGNCTWTISDGFTVLAQYTDDADAYMPDSVWPKPDGATDIAGATRGWASVDQSTVLVVKGGQGVLLNDFSLGATPGPQDAWTALGTAIAAKL